MHFLNEEFSHWVIPLLFFLSILAHFLKCTRNFAYEQFIFKHFHISEVCFIFLDIYYFYCI